MGIAELLEQDFGTIPELIREHARAQPHALALIDARQQLDYCGLDALMDRVAVALEREGVKQGEVVAICASSSVEYGAAFLGALRVGVAVAPLAPSSTAESLLAMLEDCGAKVFFVDAGVGQAMASVRARSHAKWVALDGHAGELSFEAFLAPAGAQPKPVQVDPKGAFNVIYSSGTTGTPKGIVQPHKMRWAHVRRGGDSGYGPDAVTMVSTPLYSNTTLVSFFPTVALGGTCVLMPKFDALKFLTLAQKHRATHAMLVPAQYQRLMDLPSFGDFDLSAFQWKFCTSAPFSAELKRRVIERWPGALIEYYGMTEGGGTCVLQAHKHPDKLHTVGRAAPGHDIRLIDDQGREVAVGELGEVVGASPAAMMTGYHNQPGKTSDAEWRDATGKRFIRTGDIGRFDEDGFLTLVDRKKDMIISGGFNIYPSDLEAVLTQHPAIAEASVIGVPSKEWGETPVAFVVLRAGHSATSSELQDWFKDRVGKTQRLSALELVESLPRSPIGKVLKRELRDAYLKT
jgi:long-chain acyl-CoA synthetase